MSLCVIELCKTLIQKPSITPEEGGCFATIADLMQKADFTVEYLNANHVKNMWIHYGHKGPLLVFLGHIDVVPTGPLSQWRFPPFSATEENGLIYGRGAADMKSAVAAMVAALIDFIAENKNPPFRVGLLLTSDEEGPSIDGTRYVMEVFKQRQEFIHYCVVGEPSSTEQLGDTIKIGRRGSLSGTLTLQGKQGHIAYPQLADNPIHRCAAVLHHLTELNWDPKKSPHFPPTSLQFSNIQAGTGALNVIPGTLVAHFNFRYSPEVTETGLQEHFEAILKQHQLNYHCEWVSGALPFLTQQGLLLKIAQAVILEQRKIHAKYSTEGGTSDGRFLAPTGTEVIEIGVNNSTIHQINECVLIEEVQGLKKIYQGIMEQMNQAAQISHGGLAQSA